MALFHVKKTLLKKCIKDLEKALDLLPEVSTKAARLFRLCLSIQYDYKTTVYCLS